MKKTCTICGETYPATAEYFHRRKRAKDGLRANCKTCAKKYSRNKMREIRNIKEENYREEYRKQENWNKEASQEHGVGRKELDIELVKGRKYHVPRVQRTKHIYESFTGRLQQVTDDLIILKHKRGFCECFRKVDFLIGEYEIREV